MWHLSAAFPACTARSTRRRSRAASSCSARGDRRWPRQTYRARCESRSGVDHAPVTRPIWKGGRSSERASHRRGAPCILRPCVPAGLCRSRRARRDRAGGLGTVTTTRLLSSPSNRATRRQCSCIATSKRCEMRVGGGGTAAHNEVIHGDHVVISENTCQRHRPTSSVTSSYGSTGAG